MGAGTVIGDGEQFHLQVRTLLKEAHSGIDTFGDASREISGSDYSSAEFRFPISHSSSLTPKFNPTTTSSGIDLLPAASPRELD
jgi:hypothetical protein